MVRVVSYIPCNLFSLLLMFLVLIACIITHIQLIHRAKLLSSSVLTVLSATGEPSYSISCK